MSSILDKGRKTIPKEIIDFYFEHVHLDFEFNARVNDLVNLEEKLKILEPSFSGEDR